MARKPTAVAGSGGGDAVAAIGNGETDNGGGGAGIGGADASGVVIVDPADIGGIDAGSGAADTTGEPRKRRGRKPGSRNTTKNQGALDVVGLESILLSMHAMLAALTSVKEMELDKDEAKALSNAAANVARHYDVSASQKSLDWANLVMVAGSLYGSRLFAYRLRRSTERKTKAQAQPAPAAYVPVVTFPGDGTNAVN